MSALRETRGQSDRHAEIARRYRHRGRIEKLSPMRGRMLRRRRELIKAGTWAARHDPHWSPDPVAWAAAFADVLMFLGGNPDDLQRHAHDAFVSVDTITARAAIVDADVGPSRPMSGIHVGRLIGLTCEQRLACGITTMNAIDESAVERKERVAAARRERDRLRKRRKRAEARKPTAEATRPWEAMRMSRRTWYRRGKPTSDTRGTKCVSPPFVDMAADAICATSRTTEPPTPTPDADTPTSTQHHPGGRTCSPSEPSTPTPWDGSGGSRADADEDAATVPPWHADDPWWEEDHAHFAAACRVWQAMTPAEKHRAQRRVEAACVDIADHLARHGRRSGWRRCEEPRT